MPRHEHGSPRADHWQDGRHQRKGSPRARIRTVAVALATLGIFALDTFTSMSSAIAVLYVLVIVSASDSRSRGELWWLFAGCTSLTIASFISEHGLAEDGDATLRLSFSVIAMLTVTVLLVRNLENRQRHEAQALLLDAAADAIVLRDMRGAVLLWNRGAELLYGRLRADMLGRVHHEVLESGFPLPFSAIEQALDQQDAWSGEIQQIRHDGSILTVESRWTLQRDGLGRPWAVLETSTDVSARKAADRALHISERRYRSIFETLAVAVLEYDFTAAAALLEAAAEDSDDSDGPTEYDDGRLVTLRGAICVVNANPKALQLMGLVCRDRFLERYCDFLPLVDDDLRSCLKAMQSGDALFEREVSAAGADGNTLTLSIAMRFPAFGDPVDRIQCSMVDLTEHKRLEDDVARMRADLEHAMRVTTIGEVSATIAHEVNQPLAAILTFAEAAQRWMDRGTEHEARAALQEVASAAAHAGDVVKGVRRLLNRSAREDLPIAIDDMIVDAMRFVRREIVDSDIRLVLDLNLDGVELSGDRLLLQQAVINLASNAVQAMQDSTARRTLRIATRCDVGMIIITVCDTGPGFRDDIVEEALNAFSSTKRGKMGLGLAICRSAIESHGGHIRIGNDPAGGAVVTLALPGST